MCDRLHVYTLTGNTPGPTTVVCSGIHGNEPAGFLAASTLLDICPEKGVIHIIAPANKCGIMHGIRQFPLGLVDLNRTFPYKHILNQQIMKYVERAQTVVDLHEARGYGKTKANTLTATKSLRPLARKLIEQHHLPFKLADFERIKGSLRDACLTRNIQHILVETSKLDPLETRVHQHVLVTRFILDHFHTFRGTLPAELSEERSR